MSASLSDWSDDPTAAEARITVHEAVCAERYAKAILNITEKLLPPLGLREFVGNYVAPEEWSALGIDPDRAEEIAEQAVEQANQAAQFANSFS